MRKEHIIQIATSGNILFALSNKGNLFSLKVGEEKWISVKVPIKHDTTKQSN